MNPQRDPLADEAAAWLLRLRARPEDAVLRKDLQDWTARSDRHAEAWQAARLMWQLAETVGPAMPVPANRNIPLRRWGAAAVIALAASLALLFLPALQLNWQADYVSATGETRVVDLADGSRIHLDSDSALAVDFHGARRQVTLLSGQAFFEVAHNPDRPFVVRAGAVDVTVTGTAFDVRLGGDAVTVDVQSGSVRADYPLRSGSGETQLAPGDRLVVARDGSNAETVSVPAAQIAAWRRGRLLIDSATVGELVEEIRRYHPGLVLVTDDALARRQVTGVFDLRDPLRALQTVVEPYSGKVREITPWLVVVSGD